MMTMQNLNIRRAWVLILLAVLCCNLSVNAQETYPILQLDIGPSNADAQTQEGFTAITAGDSGIVVDGITVEFGTTEDGETIQQRNRNSTGIPYELLYRDFWFTVNGGITFTLSGLNPDETYEITIYSWDLASAQDHLADWSANGEYSFTTSFTGGITVDAEDSFASSGLATADANGTIALAAEPNELTSFPGPPGQYFCFVNGMVVSSLTPLTTARDPIPGDNGIVTSTAVELQWSPGQTAVSSNVYFGDDGDAVNDATPDTPNIYLGNTADSTFAVGSPGNPYPDGLPAKTIYYWRIDSVEDDGTVHKGDVWSFTVPSREAFLETPLDTSLFIDPNLVLTWVPGAGATEHHVYFGDNMADVQAGTGGTDKGMTTEPNYVTGLLERNKTYYWRVDEFDGLETYTGDVWSFTTTLDGLGTITMDFWDSVAGDHQLPNLLNDPRYPDNPTSSSALTELGTVDGVGDGYGAQISGWLYCPVSGEYTFYFSSAGQGELWLSTDDDPGNSVLLGAENTWGSYNSFSIKSDPISLVAGNKYYIMARWKDFNAWDHCQVAWKGAGIRNQEIIQGNYLSPYDPVTSYGPVPNDSTVDVAQLPILRWKPGNQAQSHNIYFGTDSEALTLVATNQIGTEEYVIDAPLDVNQTYYWRVDEIDNGNPESPWVGKTWSFTTAPFWVVDDFENYKTSGEPGDRRIFESWHDQWGFTNPDNSNTPGNGTTMTVGTEDAPFGPELIIVNTGSQSLPLTFNNSNDPFYAETNRTFDPPQDWTQVGGQASDSLGIAVRGRWGSPNGFTADGSTYTVTGSGTDINGNTDQLHFVYQAMDNGALTARVDSVQDTADFAKAGVMIRNGLNPDSISVGVYVAPSGRVLFQYREFEGDVIVEEDTGADSITLPYWIRLNRQGNTIQGEMSADSQTWELINDASLVSVGMFGDIYYGLAVTSNVDAGTPCEAVFSSVSGSPTEELDIGLPINDPANLYVTLQNGGGPVTVINDLGTAAILTNDWMEWVIPLSSFTDQGLNLSSIREMIIGIGDKQPDGEGRVWIDDIRIYPAP